MCFGHKLRKKKLNKLVNRITVAVRSAYVGESNEFLLNYCLHNENVRSSAHVIMYPDGYLDGPATLILRLKVANHIRPQ